jgi:DHA1 family bicyclomycin/chloramphenicol resistance-like MFS transporter
MSEVRTAIVCALFVAIGPLSLALYTPALPALVAVFGTTAAAMKLTITVYFCGFAFSLLICGPLSDAFGRRPIVLSFFLIYLVGSLIASLSLSIQLLMVGRALQGVGAAAGVVASRALVRDQFTGDAAVRIMSLIGLMVGIAPAVSPTIGGLLLSTVGWHAIFLVMVGYGALLVAIAFWVGETHRTPDPLLIRPDRVLATYRRLLAHREFLWAGSLTGLCQGGFYTMPALMPFVLIQNVGLTPVEYGGAMLGQTGSYMLGATIANRLLRRFGSLRLLNVGVVIIVIAGTALAVGLRIGPPTLATVWTPAALWVFGLAFIMPGSTAAALAPFATVAGSASALLGFMQFGGGLLGSGIAALLFPTPLAALATLVPLMGLLAAIVHLALRPRGQFAHPGG